MTTLEISEIKSYTNIALNFVEANLVTDIAIHGDYSLHFVQKFNLFFVGYKLSEVLAIGQDFVEAIEFFESLMV